MKKLIGLSLLIAILGSGVVRETKVMAQTEYTWYNCRTREVFTPEKQAWCDRLFKLQNATYKVPKNLNSNPEYITVTLKNGRYQRQDNRFIVELVNQRGWLTFGDINNDGKEDAAVIFGVALDPNGKAIGTYLTAVLDIDGKRQALTPIKLGERIMLNGPIAIENDRIIIPFLTRTEVINRIYIVDGTTLRQSS
ncbi:hypothetical protein [Floridanema evergladense]|uniref:Uncharacterized protein n=1 Tax=Floridaenema evergladense BLCC-F167 TaxID=3153639 RepID=A0ABV4WWX4_9CYAN